MMVMQVTCLQWLHVWHISWTEKFYIIHSVMRIHFVHIMRRKPHHDGSVMTNPDKKRLVEIPPRSGEPPDGGIDIDSVSTLNATTSSKECNICLHLYYWTFCCLKVVSCGKLHSQWKSPLLSVHRQRGQGKYYDESNVVRCVD